MVKKQSKKTNLPESDCRGCKHCGGIGNNGCRNETAKIFFGVEKGVHMPIKNGKKYRSINCPDPKFV